MDKLLSKPQPDDISDSTILKVIKHLSASSTNIIDTRHSNERRHKRKITRMQIEQCLKKGVIKYGEAPYIDIHGNWVATLQRMAAGEEITCVVAIDWPSKLIIITAYNGDR